jgi:catechol 1,2-dioxygenase
MATPGVFPTSPESLLPIVLKAMDKTTDPRFKQVITSLTTYLHKFVIENKITEEEWQRAVQFMVGIGQETCAEKNEVILASDLLGISTLVTLINNPNGSGDSDAALLGPFWRANAPICQPGDNISRTKLEGVTLEVKGVVYGHDKKPVPNATVDVWQASPKGFYENQDKEQDDMNLRGRFKTNAAGEYFFRTVTPAGYPIPTDGPCGEIVRAQLRHPYRPAHLHFMVSDKNHKVLITQIFPEGTPYLDSDVVFGVTEALIGKLDETSRDGKEVHLLTHNFHLLEGEPVFPHPPIP